ncbi:MAG: hypothetical protein U0984_01400 [Prosthecobacter sp.]|nr:hypothetical protein [Prosthecobacter sp.]
MSALSSPHSRPGFIRSFPLLAFVLIAYNVATLGFDFDFTAPIVAPLFQIKLVSGAIWSTGWNEVLLISGLALLFIEILKSSRTTTQTTFEHLLSMLVFIIFIVEFLIVPAAGTNTFFILGVMALIDVMAGYAVSVAVARKDLNISG